LDDFYNLSLIAFLFFQAINEHMAIARQTNTIAVIAESTASPIVKSKSCILNKV